MRSAALPALALQLPQALPAAPTWRAHLSRRARQDRLRSAPGGAELGAELGAEPRPSAPG